MAEAKETSGEGPSNVDECEQSLTPCTLAKDLLDEIVGNSVLRPLTMEDIRAAQKVLMEVLDIEAPFPHQDSELALSGRMSTQELESANQQELDEVTELDEALKGIEEEELAMEEEELFKEKTETAQAGIGLYEDPPTVTFLKNIETRKRKRTPEEATAVVTPPSHIEGQGEAVPSTSGDVVPERPEKKTG